MSTDELCCGGKQSSRGGERIPLLKTNDECVPDEEILWRVRSGYEVFITKKDVLNEKLKKIPHPNLFKNSVFLVMKIANEMWATMKKEEKVLVMTRKDPRKIVVRTHLKRNNLVAETSEGPKYGIS